MYSNKKATLPGKIRARQATLIDMYREITGNTAIPSNKQYWTLCASQPNTEGSEINQLVKEKLLIKKQFYGVDTNKKHIKFNKQNHPGAHWVRGNWKDVIYRWENYDPALIYLDTMFSAGHQNAVDITIDTIRTPCKENTIIVVNVILINYKRGDSFEKEIFINNVRNAMTPMERKTWEFYPEGTKKFCYPYKSAVYLMGTYFLVRRKT